MSHWHNLVKEELQAGIVLRQQSLNLAEPLVNIPELFKIFQLDHAK